MKKPSKLYPKKSILFVTTVSDTVKGFLLGYGKYFRSKGYIVDVLCRGGTESKDIREAFDHVYDASWTRGIFSIENIRMIRSIKLLVKRNGYTLVSVHTPVAAFVTRFALKNSGIKVVYTAHGFHFHRYGTWFNNFLFRNLEKIAGKWTAGLIVINEEDWDKVRRYKIVPDVKLYMTNGIGVDLTRFYGSGNALDRKDNVLNELGLGLSEEYYICIGELNPGKRIADAIIAFAAFPKKGNHLVIAGDGPERKTLEELSARLGVAGHVHFLGFRKDIPRLLKNAQALIFPSEREGLSVSVMEAMASEIPVVGSDARGVLDLIGDGCGYVFKVGDVMGISSQLCRLKMDPAEKREVIKKARSKVKLYGKEELLKVYNEIFDEVLIQ